MTNFPNPPGFDGFDGFDDDVDAAALGGRLDAVAGGLADSSAPVAAILAGGRKRANRRRIVGGSALSVTTLGLAVAVGVGAGGAGAAHSTVNAGSGGDTTTAVPPHITTTTAAAPARPLAPQTTVIAEGDLGGTHWKLVRVLRQLTPQEMSAGPWKDCRHPGEIQEDYIETSDGKKDLTGTGGFGCDTAAPWSHDFTSTPYAGAGYTAVGVGSFGDSLVKGNPSPYGHIASGVVGPRVAKVVVTVPGHAPVTATLLPSEGPAPENGRYFYATFANPGPETGNARFAMYDANGQRIAGW